MKSALRMGVMKVEKNVLERLYRRYAKAVYLYLYSLCHDHALAEDLMQEAFLKALGALELSETAVLPWLLMVARNMYFDVLRKDRRLMPHDGNGEDRYCRDAAAEGTGRAGKEGNEILDKLIRKERNQLLYRTIQKLKSTEKEAVVLYYFTGLSQEEISRIMGVTYGNVRVILYRAKKNLKKLLDGEEMMSV